MIFFHFSGMTNVVKKWSLRLRIVDTMSRKNAGKTSKLWLASGMSLLSLKSVVIRTSENAMRRRLPSSAKLSATNQWIAECIIARRFAASVDILIVSVWKQ